LALDHGNHGFALGLRGNRGFALSVLVMVPVVMVMTLLIRLMARLMARLMITLVWVTAVPAWLSGVNVCVVVVLEVLGVLLLGADVVVVCLPHPKVHIVKQVEQVREGISDRLLHWGKRVTGRAFPHGLDPRKDRQQRRLIRTQACRLLSHYSDGFV